MNNSNIKIQDYIDKMLEEVKSEKSEHLQNLTLITTLTMVKEMVEELENKKRISIIQLEALKMTMLQLYKGGYVQQSISNVFCEKLNEVIKELEGEE